MSKEVNYLKSNKMWVWEIIILKILMSYQLIMSEKCYSPAWFKNEITWLWKDDCGYNKLGLGPFTDKYSWYETFAVGVKWRKLL